MAKTPATNYSSPGYSYATADADTFDRTDVAGIGASVDGHDHSSGKGLPIAAGSIPNGTITSAMIADGTIQAADIATGTITTTQIADGTIATADLANNAVTNAKLGTDTARLNLLTNGGMEVWQRGAGPITAVSGGAWTADRWLATIVASDTLSVSRNTANVDAGSGACAACVFTLSGGAGGTFFNQKIEDYLNLRGRTITVSIRVNTSVANAVRVSVYNGSTNTYSNYHTGSGTYETLTATAVVGTGATLVTVANWFNASCTAYLDNAMLVVGSVPADYAPLHPADDLARCLRYYEVFGFSATNSMQGNGYCAGVGQNVNVQLTFRAYKPVTPTVTKVGTWAVTNTNQPVAYSSATETSLTGSALAVGFMQFYPNSAANGITVEANP